MLVLGHGNLDVKRGLREMNRNGIYVLVGLNFEDGHAYGVAVLCDKRYVRIHKVSLLVLPRI